MDECRLYICWPDQFIVPCSHRTFFTTKIAFKWLRKDCRVSENIWWLTQSLSMPDAIDTMHTQTENWWINHRVFFLIKRQFIFAVGKMCAYWLAYSHHFFDSISRIRMPHMCKTGTGSRRGSTFNSAASAGKYVRFAADEESRNWSDQWSACIVQVLMSIRSVIFIVLCMPLVRLVNTHLFNCSLAVNILLLGHIWHFSC